MLISKWKEQVEESEWLCLACLIDDMNNTCTAVPWKVTSNGLMVPMVPSRCSLLVGLDLNMRVRLRKSTDPGTLGGQEKIQGNGRGKLVRGVLAPYLMYLMGPETF